MKKTITIILLAILLFNTLIITPVYADTEQDMTKALEGTYTQNTATQYQNTGTAATGIDRTKNINGNNILFAERQDAKTTALSNDQDSFLAASIAGLLGAFVQVCRIPLDFIANHLTDNSMILTGKINTFTIENLIYGYYPFFNINFFNSAGLTEAASTAEAAATSTQANGVTIKNASMSATQTIKLQISGWYYGIRTIAIIASLAILIYAAIKMALSTVMAEKTRYKKMLTDWAVSLLILFALHYFMILLINISEMLVSLLRTVQPPTGLEVVLHKKMITNDAVGWDKLVVAVMEALLTFLQIKFLLIYLKRLVVTGFLITIAPIITITYPLDRIRDKETGSFTSWRKEFTTLVFIQPLHMLLYILIFVSAGQIMLVSPFIACILIWVTSKAEGILRNMFKLNGADSIKSLRDTKVMGKSLFT